jgi:hypothetical protein
MKQLELPLGLAEPPKAPVQLDLFDLEPFTKLTRAQQFEKLYQELRKRDGHDNNGYIVRPLQFNSVPLQFTVDSSKNVFANEASDEAIQNEASDEAIQNEAGVSVP